MTKADPCPRLAKIISHRTWHLPGEAQRAQPSQNLLYQWGNVSILIFQGKGSTPMAEGSAQS